MEARAFMTIVDRRDLHSVSDYNSQKKKQQIHTVVCVLFQIYTLKLTVHTTITVLLWFI